MMARGALADAEVAMERAIELADDDWVSVWVAGLAEVWLGTIDRALRDEAAARSHLDRGLAGATRRGDRLTSYVALFNLAQLDRAAGDTAAARGHLAQAVRLTVETRDAANLAAVADALAVIEEVDGRPDRVPLLLGCAEAMREEVGGRVYGYYLPDEEEERRVAEAARAALGEEQYDDRLDHGRGLAFDEVVAELQR
jgi:hypothetical protein